MRQVIICSCSEDSGRILPPRSVIGSSGKSRMDAGAMKNVEHVRSDFRPQGMGVARRVA
jgi:hypothetical protein